MTATDSRALEQLADLAHAVGWAQLAQAGYDPGRLTQATLVEVPAGPMWTAGAARADAIDPGTDRDDARRTAVSMLGTPSELLLLLGADDRVVPSHGRNCYAQRIVDLDPQVRLSSCTSSPPDAAAIASAESWRLAQLAKVLSNPAAPDVTALHADVTARIVAHLELPEEWAQRTVLTTSGTDTESVVTALASGAGAQPILNILVGAAEAGRGTRSAAAGRTSTASAAFVADRPVDAPLSGFGSLDIRVADVAVRNADGTPRAARDVAGDLDHLVETAIRDGRRAIVHVLDASKTGLRHPSLAWIQAARATYGADLGIVVDSAQLRSSADAIRGYLDAGASVMLTGSKAVGGPPFCGALILAAAAHSEAGRIAALPAGLADSMARADLTPSMAHLATSWEPVNWGLLARWHVALAEWDALLAVPPAQRTAIRDTLLSSLRSRLTALAGVSVLDDDAAEPSIVSFLTEDPAGQPAGLNLATERYLRLVVDHDMQLGAPVELVPAGPTVLRFAVGAATVSRLAASAAPVRAAEAMAELAVDQVASVR